MRQGFFASGLTLYKKRQTGLLPLLSGLGLSLAIAATSAQAAHEKVDEMPLWTLDLGLSAITIDSYPGADYNRVLVFPFPNFRLNSPYLQSSGSGVNARILNSEKLDIGLTLGGSIPTKTKHLDARNDRDMPDLDPTVEMGLGLRYTPVKTHNWELVTSFPLRKATGIAFDDQDEFWKVHKPLDLGWSFSPRIILIRHIKIDDVKHEIDIEVGSRYATQQNMNFFYGVDDKLALSPADIFVADEGLVNHWATIGWVRKYDRWRFSIAGEYQDMHDAENIDSPLLEVKDSWFGFVILSYSFAQSEVMVQQNNELRQ